MKHLFIGLLLLATSICLAQVYQQIDKHGGITYSDSPLNNSAEPINLPTINQIQAPQAAPSSTSGTDSSVTTQTTQGLPLADNNNLNQPYTTFLIDTPKNEETIQNQPIIPVKIKTDPALRDGDTIQLLVDGNPSGPPQSGKEFELKDVDRGTHQISAVLIGQNQSILNQSNTITIYVHHASVSTINANQNKPAIPVGP